MRRFACVAITAITVMLTAAPRADGLLDELAMKAGTMETAGIYVVNKAYLPA